MTLKRDADEIRAFLERLSRESWLGTRSQLPLHLFRIDDVNAAVSILESGALYSRNRAEELGLLGHDSASPGVIEQSPHWSKECVRLYFRPKTPAEYRSEGFRPVMSIEMGAHRPMPIVFVFKSIPIMVTEGTSFTNGNAATGGVQRGTTAEFLKSIPFQRVYHDGALPVSDKRDYIFRRCAEVLVKDELTLDHLQHVLCRSQAEYETLMDLLSERAKAKNAKKIGISGRVHLRRWTFIEAVDLSADRIDFRFSPMSMTPGPFDMEIVISTNTGQALGGFRDKAYKANSTFALSLKNLGQLEGYRVTLKLDGLLAYSGVYTAGEALI